MKKRKRSCIYGAVFVLLVLLEVLIALFVRDRFLRPYGGDILVIGVLYCFVRIFVPDEHPLLPVYIFAFAVLVELAQGFDLVALLGLEDSSFFRILLGTTFSWGDILCYAAGSGLCILAEWLIYKIRT